MFFAGHPLGVLSPYLVFAGYPLGILTPYLVFAGYPLDIPPPGAGLLTYAVLVYHLPLLIGFSLRPRAAFVWGGCMLLPLAHLRADTYGIMAVR